MEINIPKLIGGVVGVVSLLLVLGTGYFLYTVFFEENTVEIYPTTASLDSRFFGPKISSAVGAIINSEGKMSFKQKDTMFMDTPLFKLFVDQPELIPLTDSRGRPYPFVPYVAP